VKTLVAIGGLVPKSFRLWIAVPVLIATLAAPAFAACPDFLYARAYPAGDATSPSAGPKGTAVADFNGDGKLDLAIANIANYSLSILLGNGDGTFAPFVHYGADLSGFAVVAADFNGDTKKDLAIANGGTGVDVFLGVGDGTFGSPANFATGTAEVSSNPLALAAGDFNGDTKVDLVTANQGSGNLSILLGNGNGTFAAFVQIGGGGSPNHVALGDFNSDNKSDIAVANYSQQTVSVLMGNGNGTFASPISYAIASEYATAVAVGDFDGDTKSDLVATNQNSVWILLNDGGGTFAAAVQYQAGAAPRHVTTGDFNGDGDLDVATANGSYDASILFGNGDGTLDPAIHYAADVGPSFVTTGDFDAATGVDVAVANTTSNNVSILLNSGDGTFVARENYGHSAGNNVTIGDFNGDGLADTATTNQSVVTVRFGDGTGRLGAGVTHNAGTTPIAAAAGDFNGDARNDLAVANANDTIQILIANSSGFEAAVPILVGGSIAQIVVSDLNLDGKNDLALANYGNDNATVLLGNGNGTFATPVSYATGENPNGIAVGDFNNDNKKDLATADYSDDTISILLGNGNGGFGAPTSFETGANPVSGQTGPTMVAVADFNGDGNSDLVANGTLGDIQILLGNGNGTFGSAVSYNADEASIWLTSLAVGDFNTDGKADVAVGALILLGNGDGTLAEVLRSQASGTNVFAYPAVADFDGDRRPDLALSEGGPDVSILLNTSSCPMIPAVPSGLIATATNATTVGLTWSAAAGASSYVVERKAAGGAFTAVGTPAVNSLSDTSAAANTAYLYRVRAVNAVGASANSASDLATTLIFIDPSLSGVVVKATHLSQLRTAANAVRSLAGLTAATLTDSATAGTTVKAIHVSELRTAIETARNALGLVTTSFTDTSVASVVIKALHMTELRGAVQ
jgi:hypothetical protein